MEFFKENKSFIFLFFLTSVCLFFSMGHLSNIYNDIGREIYYPLEILKGKVLYKDLFCIYGPFSYLLNAFLYKIFGAKLSTLYFAGTVSALSIVSFVYLISKKFLSEFESFSIALFVILTGCLATRIFNYTLPYSYAALYGLVSFLISIYFLICYVQNKKNHNLYIASIFGGISICSKYEFFLYIIPLLFVIFKTKNIKITIKALSVFFLTIFIPFLVLFVQGIKISDFISAIQAIKAFAGSESLRVFYITQGVYYTNRIWIDWLFKILAHIFGFALMYFGILLVYKKEIFKKIFGIILAFVSIFCYYSFTEAGSYLFLTFLTLLILILKFKKNTYAENLFIVCAILISLKSLWGISHVNYGIYYIGVILISFFILAKNNTNKIFSTSLSLILISMALNYLTINISWILTTNERLKTDKGAIYTQKYWAEATNELIDYIENIKTEKPKVVILPEGLTVNYLAKKETKAEGFYNSLIPLYTESFGEKEIIEYYKKEMPDYIIFSSLDNSSYNKGEICVTYAFDICNFTLKNYEKSKEIKAEKDASFIIFKKK